MEIVAEGDIRYPKEESQQALFASHNNNHRLSQSKKTLPEPIQEGKRVVHPKIRGLGHFLECVQSERTS